MILKRQTRLHFPGGVDDESPLHVRATAGSEDDQVIPASHWLLLLLLIPASHWLLLFILVSHWSIGLRCPGCLSDQATVPVLYCKPSQGHIQLAKWDSENISCCYLMINFILTREGKFSIEKMGPKQARYLCKSCNRRFSIK